MEYIKSSQNWECDSHDSSKFLVYPTETDEIITKDSSKNKLINSSCYNPFKMGSAKKLLSAVEPSEEILNLLAKARDDLRKQEATKAGENMAKEKLVEAKQSASPDNFQVVAEHRPTHQFDERKGSSNKSVDNIFEKALACKTPNFVECNQQKQGESLESLLQIDAVRVPIQAAKYYERKPFTPKWFEHDDRDREDVEEAAAKKFEGVNMKSIQNKSSCEAVNRWGHDLYDASQENQDEFPRYSKQLFPRPINKRETVDRWGHDLYDADATQQTPKSDQEFSDFYGCGRRQVNSRSPSKYRSSFQEGAESACPRPFRGRGDAARSQPRSEDQVNAKKDEISTITRDMKNFYL